jgi:hypothetical protein
VHLDSRDVLQTPAHPLHGSRGRAKLSRWTTRTIDLTLQDLANLAEFAGGVAVVASLVYVAVQVRQNTQSLRTENYTRALDRISSMQSQMSGNGPFAAVFARGVTDASSLSPQERIQFTWWAYEAFGAFEFMFHQAQTRAIPDEVWERWSATIAWWLSFPGIRSWWMARPVPFSESFTAYVEACLRENQVDLDAARRWQAFVSGPQPARPRSDSADTARSST